MVSDARERLAAAGVPDDVAERVIEAIANADVDAALDAIVDMVFGLMGFGAAWSASKGIADA